MAHASEAVNLVVRGLTAQDYLFVGFERLLGAFSAAVAGQGPAPKAMAEMKANNRLVHELFEPANQQ